METGAHIRLVLWKAAKAVEKVDRQSIARTGLKLTDFQIMEVLLHEGPLPINTIAGKVLLTSGSMTAAAGSSSGPTPVTGIPWKRSPTSSRRPNARRWCGF